MDVYKGNELKDFVRGSLIEEYKERFILKDLHDYMTSKNDRKVCCLYGLRRTGKTVMALQEIRNLEDYGMRGIKVVLAGADSLGFLIPAGNEPKSRMLTSVGPWRMPRGSHTIASYGRIVLCSAARLMPMHRRCFVLCSGVVDCE